MRTLHRLSLLCLVALLISCGSAKISADYDKELDFTQYKTYLFLPWHPDNSKLIDKVEQSRIYKTIENELAARGMKKVDYKADVAVNVIAIINKDKKYHVTYNMYRPSYYSYYYGFGYSTGGGSAVAYGNFYNPYGVSEFERLYGGLVIDFFDVKEKKQIWQGSATGNVSADEKKREVGGPSAVVRILKKYPLEKK